MTIHRRGFGCVAALLAVACTHSSSGQVTYSLEGGGSTGCNDELTRGGYAITLAAFANGPDKVDLADYERKTFALARSVTASQGGTPREADLLIDHIKDIPRQFIGIVRGDPKVLASCEAYELALSGPP